MDVEETPLNGRASRVDSEVNEKPVVLSTRELVNTVTLMTYLNVLQGIVVGFTFGLPLLMQNIVTKQNCDLDEILIPANSSSAGQHNCTLTTIKDEVSATYTAQSLFRFSAWPLAIKFAWAPIVDIFYIPVMGPRKTYIIPLYLIIGTTYFYLSMDGHLALWITDITDSGHFWSMFISWMIINFCGATVDVAIDGWAVQRLGDTHANLASISNMSGNCIGCLFSLVMAIIWHEEKIVPIDWFVFSCGVLVFASVFMLIFVEDKEIEEFKKVKDRSELSENAGAGGMCAGWAIEKRGDLDLGEMYARLKSTMLSPSTMTYIMICLVNYIPFGTPDASFRLQMADFGVCKKQIAYVDILIFVLGGLVPVLLVKLTYQPAVFWRWSYIFRLLGAAMVSTGFHFIGTNVSTMTIQTALIIFTATYGFYSIFLMTDHVSIFAMSALLTDRKIAGTSITFLVGISNLSYGSWMSVGLYLIGWFDQKCTDRKFMPGLSGYMHAYIIMTAIGIVFYVLLQPRVTALHKDLESRKNNK